MANLNSRHRLSGCPIREPVSPRGNIATNANQFLGEEGATLIRESATAYFEKSKLELDDKGELLAYIVKKALDGAAVD